MELSSVTSSYADPLSRISPEAKAFCPSTLGRPDLVLDEDSDTLAYRKAAYLLDQSAWGFLGNEFTDLVAGSPSTEILMSSSTQKYGGTPQKMYLAEGYSNGTHIGLIPVTNYNRQYPCFSPNYDALFDVSPNGGPNLICCDPYFIHVNGEVEYRME